MLTQRLGHLKMEDELSRHGNPSPGARSSRIPPPISHQTLGRLPAYVLQIASRVAEGKTPAEVSKMPKEFHPGIIMYLMRYNDQFGLNLQRNQQTHQTMYKKEMPLRPKMGAVSETERFSICTVEKGDRSPILLNELLKVWDASVRASHHFLTEADITRLTPQAEGALRHIETLWVMKDGRRPVGFMGVQERKMEMLFLHPDYFRKGLGKALVQRAFDELGVELVDVNEQNPDAKRFYEQMGFNVFKRNECDSEGNPFPILEMKR